MSIFEKDILNILNEFDKVLKKKISNTILASQFWFIALLLYYIFYNEIFI